MSFILDLVKDKSIKRNWQVGAEIERFVFLRAEKKIAQYSSHIAPVMNELHNTLSWEILYAPENQILGLHRDGHQITLEPGAQFEISPAPQPHLLKIQKFESEIQDEVLRMPSAQDWSWLELGVNPWNQATEMELIPSSRYRYMTEYFPQRAKRGIEMMRLTTGFHLNLDYFTEQEALDLLKSGFYLAPYVTALFANSPFYQSKRAPRLSERMAIWEETDPVRCGYIPGVFDSSFSLKDYVNFVENIPLMYFNDKEDEVQPGSGKTFRDLSLREQEMNAVAAMRQVFTEVRLKPCCLEFRSFDEMKFQDRYAAMAFVTGLLYDSENRNRLLKEIKMLNTENWSKYHRRLSIEGMKDHEVYNKLKSLMSWSIEGLLRRKNNEEGLIQPAEDLLSLRKTPAELLCESPEWSSFQ